MKKLFVGVSVENDTENILGTFSLRHRQLQEINWVAQENFHMTLCYIGYTEEEDIILNKLENICTRHKLFTLDFEQIEIFSKEENPEIIWARYSIISNFIELTNALHEELTGEPPSRKIIPHITLGRIKGGVQPSEFNLNFISNLPFFPIGKLTLWESQDFPEGVKYIPLGEFELDNNLR